ncbi:MAG: hypothetical protein ACKVOU_07905 [Cytophagales bacterium]
MNNIYIYAAIAIAYQVFRFLQARQKSAKEAAEKSIEKAEKQTYETVKVEKYDAKKETVFFEGYGETVVHPVFTDSKIVSYENPDQKPLVENTEIKAYQIPKNKKAAVENRSYEIKKPADNHPILKGLRSKSEIKKAFIYSEIFSTKF